MESRRRRAAVVIVCAALLALFAAISWSAARGKSSTVDEPLHALAAYINSTLRDYRIDPEDPPLWTYWMALPNVGGAGMKLDFASPQWWGITQTYWTQNSWWRDAMYATPGNDGEMIVRRSRAMALVIGVTLGALIAWCAWRTSGPVAAVVAAGLFTLDPNFLGHAPLVKNDVAISLLFLGAAMATCAVGRRATIGSVALLGVIVGAAMATKFSGLLLVPIVAGMLAVRATMSQPWNVIGRELTSRSRKMLAAACLCAGAAAVAILTVWASYGFRYTATADGTPMNIRLQSALVSKAKFLTRHPGAKPSPAELAATDPGPLTHTAVFLNDHHLMPEAWLNGLLYTHHQSIVRESFLLGHRGDTGWWSYFPLAMLFKTPAATMIAIITSLAWLIRRRRWVEWRWLCLLIPPAVYLAVAMTSNLNLGVRHVLPVYPFLFVIVGGVFAALREHLRRAAAVVGGVLVIGLAVESLAAYPNYIAFFSVARGPYRPIGLLADSNLDWGQDLPALARWRREHTERSIFVRYFGTPEPTIYVPDARRLELGNWPASPAYVAVSATYLQGLHQGDAWNEFLAPIRRQTPLAILGGGTIYVFETPPPP